MCYLYCVKILSKKSLNQIFETSLQTKNLWGVLYPKVVQRLCNRCLKFCDLFIEIQRDRLLLESKRAIKFEVGDFFKKATCQIYHQILKEKDYLLFNFKIVTNEKKPFR